MRIDKTELIDVGVQTANAERREAVRDTDKNLSVVRIDRSRQGKRWLEQATYGNPSVRREDLLRGYCAAGREYGRSAEEE